MIAFRLGVSGQKLVFSDAVVEHFWSHRQLKWWQPEAGGQLFARIDGSWIEVVLATGPRISDRRSRVRYEPNHVSEQNEIEANFESGLHFVGDWHTHPEDVPRPSWLDMRSMKNSFNLSRHSLRAFVMVIVGRKEFPQALYVSVVDSHKIHVLERD